MWVRIPSAPMHMQVVCNNVEIERSESNKSSLTQYNFQFALGTHKDIESGWIYCVLYNLLVSRGPTIFRLLWKTPN